jgi:hypothetical protein
MKRVMGLCLAGLFLMAMGLDAEQRRETRPVGDDFSGIEMATHGELRVMVGEKVELVVEAADDMMKQIITEVRGDTLVIRRKDRSSNWLRQLLSPRREQRMRFTLTVLADQLNHLRVTSHGDVVLPQLKGDRVRVELTSHGEVEIDEISATAVDIELSSHGDLLIGQLQAERLTSDLTSHGLVKIRSGRVRTQRVSLSSHGDYLAEGLECEDVDVDLSSHGTAKVFATRQLGASITSHGDLYYRGSPELDIPRSQMKHVRAIR